MRSLSVVLGLAAALGAAAPAGAAWQVAKSKHFVIYADDRPNRLSEFATRLERFDHAARALLQMDDPVVGDGNRVTVFVMPNVKDVRALAGGDEFLSGFYKGRAAGSVAYVAKRGDDSDLGTDTVLFHEYAHHLMMQQLDQPYPEWYVEGFAEFLSTPIFKKDGAVQLGAPPQHRGWGLFYGKQLALDALLGGTYGDIQKLSPELRESIYGRGWLLTHYFNMEPKRGGQLAKYVLGIAKGVPPLQSAQQSFGDFRQLEKELDSYQRTRFRAYTVSSHDAPPPVDVQPLSPGGAAVILLRAEVKNGVGKDQLEPTANRVRAVQARFPGDELVEATLAEAELDAGHAAAAEAAADRAVKANPRNTEALVLKGRAMAERAEVLQDPQRHALFEQARDTFIAANKLDLEDPEPLMEFYKAYVTEGERPNANALAALHYASDLAPQDIALRMNSAIAYLNEGKLKDARVTLIPVAYSPHARSAAQAARRMIAKIDAGDGRAALMAISGDR